MPRQPRRIQVGGIYHVVQRGVERRKIFLKKQDYSRFILGLEFFNSDAPARLWELIAKAGTVPASQRLGEMRQQEVSRKRLIELMAFALMPNHFHLLVREIRSGGLSAFMRKMGGYATYFNKQYDRVGSLFQSRFRHVEVKDDAQLTSVFVYIHTNPVELWEPGWKDFDVRDPREAIRRLGEYRWSSYRDYIGETTFPTATQSDFFIELFGGVKGCRKVVGEWVRLKEGRRPFGEEVIE